MPKVDLLTEHPKTVDDFRTAIYETVGNLDMGRVDDMIEYIYYNRNLLEKWAEDYLV